MLFFSGGFQSTSYQVVKPEKTSFLPLAHFL